MTHSFSLVLVRVLYDKTFTSIRILQVLHVRVVPKAQPYLLEIYYFVRILEQVCFSSTRYGCIQLWHLCCWDCQGNELHHLLISFDLSLSLSWGCLEVIEILVYSLPSICFLLKRVLLYCAGCVGRSWISCKSNSSFCSSGGPSTAPHYYPHKICWRGMSCAIILSQTQIKAVVNILINCGAHEYLNQSKESFPS